MNAWYFAYRSKRQEGDLPTLWALARQAVAGQLEDTTFARALAIRTSGTPKADHRTVLAKPGAVPSLKRRDRTVSRAPRRERSKQGADAGASTRRW